MVVLLFLLSIAAVDSLATDMFSGLNELINLNSTVRKPSSSTVNICYAAGSVAILMFASLVFSISSKNRKGFNTGSYEDVSTEISEAPAAASESRRSDDDAISWKSASDVLLQEDNDGIVLEADAKYAEELQVQEALLSSIFTSQTTNNASTSTHKSRSSLSSLLKKKETEPMNPPQSFCEICLENRDTWQMFGNPTCSHSFCYECTGKHATTKIHENENTITCPGLNCKSPLDFNSLRLIVPKEILIKWDESLCKSTILESHKLYCPFSDCSVLLINDNSGIKNTDCPVCRRSFCAACRVPWHSEFTCKEFQKLNMKKKGKKEDEMAEALAKKKKWKKCPSCKFFVEKNEGCLHITCRCKYEFCYNCRAKWSSTHGSCRPRA